MSALENLYEWFKKQLSRASIASEGDANGDDHPPNVVDTQNSFIQTQIEAVLGALGAPQCLDSRVITIRKRFCEIHEYLRPVYAEPADLNPYLTLPGQQMPFNIEFGESDEGAFESIPSHLCTRTETRFLCIHPIPDNLNGRPTIEAKTIAERLTRFWQNTLMGTGRESDLAGYEFAARVNELNRLKLVSGKALYCVFAGSLGGAAEGNKRKLKALFGTYLVHDEEWADSLKPEALEKALGEAADLFRGLEVISQLDARVFELQGLRRIATLLPDFVNEDIPRSDKISAALWSLKQQLTQHLVGRPDWNPGEEPKLFYLSASFERVPSGWLPRLEVYPHAYRDEFPLVSLLVSHAEIPSASKFLLKTYLDEHWNEMSMVRAGVTLEPEFAGLFTSDHLAVPDLDAWLPRVMRGDEATCLHMVEHDEVIASLATGGLRNPWEVLNHSVDSSGPPSRSLLAFVIEGEKRTDGRAFPRGILALESGAIDAFSDQDIEALRVVVKTFGSLVRLITHDNACLDYRTKLSEAFQAELRHHLPVEEEAAARFRKFVFSVKKIDGKQFHKLLDDAIPNSRDSDADRARGERIWNLLQLTPSDVANLMAFKDAIESHPDEEVPDQVEANKIVARRVEWAIREVQALFDSGQLVGKLNKYIVEFLFACTENFQWSAYLSSMAQALGDRAIKAVPEFQMMTPGYSASSMFMASVTQELRQVVKLSEHSKLSRERENYKTYVRYRLVNSARMPVNGFAFDGVGWRDPEDEKTSGKKYGALVSDLISAERDETDPIKTFVTLLCECVDEEFDADRHMQILHSIRGLFEHGTALWQEESSEDAGFRPENFNIAAFIRDVSRLSISRNLVSDLLDNRIRRRKDLDRAVDFFTCIYNSQDMSKKVVDLLFDAPETMPTSRAFLNSLYQISHNDLNSRNLTWSSALTTFLMIDFEHVGRSYLGHDQTRLWVNAICDLYNESRNERVKDDRIGCILVATDDLIERTEKYLNYLAGCTKNDGNSIVNYVSDFFPEHAISKGVIDFSKMRVEDYANLDYFRTFFISLFLSFPRVRGVSGMTLYSFYCNILKEFEYSSRDISKSRVADIMAAIGNPANLNSENIHKIVFQDESFTIPTQGLYFRHLTAARLLKVAYDALDKLKRREVRSR